MSDVTDGFVGNIKGSFNSDYNETVFDALFREYEHVIFRSLITSFGLDIFIKDQYGGDVDTLYNVRAIGKDSQLRYKNAENERAFDSRDVYSHDIVDERESNYRTIKSKARAWKTEQTIFVTSRKCFPDNPKVRTGDVRHKTEATVK